MQTSIIQTGMPANTHALRLPEAAASVRCSRRFLENQIKAGYLRVIRLSARRVRIRPADLISYLDRRSV